MKRYQNYQLFGWSGLKINFFLYVDYILLIEVHWKSKYFDFYDPFCFKIEFRYPDKTFFIYYLKYADSTKKSCLCPTVTRCCLVILSMKRTSASGIHAEGGVKVTSSYFRLHHKSSCFSCSIFSWTFFTVTVNNCSQLQYHCWLVSCL